jgi:sorbitol-specific phosphotransferase system component IIA
LKFVKYDGYADGYLLILTNKKRSSGTIGLVDEIPVARLYVQKGQVIAVSDQNFETLKEQGHITNTKDGLQEVEKTSTYGPGDKPYFRVINP